MKKLFDRFRRRTTPGPARETSPPRATVTVMNITAADVTVSTYGGGVWFKLGDCVTVHVDRSDGYDSDNREALRNLAEIADVLAEGAGVRTRPVHDCPDATQALVPGSANHNAIWQSTGPRS